MTRKLRGVLGVVVVTAAHVTVPAQTTPRIDDYLRSMGLNASEIADAANGKSIVKFLPSTNDRDVVVFGVIAVRVARDEYLAHALDSGRLIGAGAHRFHVIADPATPADVEGVAFDEGEYRDLRGCKRDDCKFKLPASAMKGFADSISWSAPDAKAQADARLRADLLRLIDGYRAHGDTALPTYDDTRGTRAADAFSALLAQSTVLYEYAPDLQRYLADYPLNRPPNTREFLYWSEDHLRRLRPTLTLSHVVMYTPPTGVAVIAKKQLYASHYFEGAFELLAAVVDERAPSPTTYLLTVRRYRFDNLPGGLFNIRNRVRNQIRDMTRDDLARERESVGRLK